MNSLLKTTIIALIYCFLFLSLGLSLIDGHLLCSAGWITAILFYIVFIIGEVKNDEA